MSELIREALRNYMEEQEWLQDHPVREAPRSPCRTGRLTGRLKEDRHEEAASTAAHTCGALRQGVQRPAGRGPVRVRPATGAQGVRQGQRLLRGPRVRGRGRERPRRRPAPVQGDDRGGRQAQGPLRRDSRMEIQPLHPPSASTPSPSSPSCGARASAWCPSPSRPRTTPPAGC